MCNRRVVPGFLDMTDLRFAGTTGQPHRRRRLLATDLESDRELSAGSVDDSEHHERGVLVFSLLTRDKLIRRVFSPRVWKHVLVATALIGVPLVLLVLWATDRLTWIDSAARNGARSPAVLKRLAALSLFVGAQLALLIGWVRSASTVDFRGRFRSWYWLSGLLFIASAVSLTDSLELCSQLMAAVVEPMIGDISAARPALLLVPAAAVFAAVLWMLVPDMSRCRAAQVMLAGGVAVMVMRVLSASAIGDSDAAVVLPIGELLAANLLLAALQLHARFVIHVNPNPPAVSRPSRRSTISLVTNEPAECVTAVDTLLIASREAQAAPQTLPLSAGSLNRDSETLYASEQDDLVTVRATGDRDGYATHESDRGEAAVRSGKKHKKHRDRLKAAG